VLVGHKDKKKDIFAKLHPQIKIKENKLHGLISSDEK